MADLRGWLQTELEEGGLIRAELSGYSDMA